MLHMFSDESKAHGYITAAVVVPAGSVTRVRAVCRDWAMPGSHRFHAQKESTTRRRAALARLIAHSGDVRLIIVESEHGQHDHTARGAHLRALARWAGAARVSRWVIERDDAVLAVDRRALAAARSIPGFGSLEYLHLPAAQEPLLWAADLAAWGWARGGEFRTGIEPLVVARIRL